ncbi:hypothetical protein GCM10007989_04900 [Devosia pacifica]|uniref:Uncharacterized protein n=1 Tax=Devosia pacifica TaxID=1335967 RepID=A0A918RUL3_9HYPH|nr:hypothetical protein [Devosia pacifica]GHA13326.1 hypothetical protein GCM10007989_04900 [Devosia pacifica]
MAKSQQPETGLVSVTLIEKHDLPGLKLRPGTIKVSPELRDELAAAGKLAE